MNSEETERIYSKAIIIIGTIVCIIIALVVFKIAWISFLKKSEQTSQFITQDYYKCICTTLEEETYCEVLRVTDKNRKNTYPVVETFEIDRNGNPRPVKTDYTMKCQWDPEAPPQYGDDDGI